MTEYHEDWGESYPYSDFKKGETISYRSEGLEEHGEIIWVSAGGILPVSGRNMPPHYIVANDRGDWPDSVFFSDVVMSEEPVMTKCPYCFGSHYEIANCPLNPNRRRS